MSSELESWLILHRAPGLGVIGAMKALRFFKNPQAIITATDSERRQSGLFRKNTLNYFAKADFSRIETDLELLKLDNMHIIHFGHRDYPDLLSKIADPPLVLYLRGNPELLHLPQIAIVGSRNPDNSGKRISYEFAENLANSGVTITSGLATGVDTAAHQGAIHASASTIAVLGTGIEMVYPARNRDLAHIIAEQGLLVSEFPPDTEPKGENFPRRNRIITGLSLGTLVVQAALKSGSLISARLALEQGREVFAIPGSINNPQAKGTHALIKNGASLVESPADIVDELGAMLGFLDSKKLDKPCSLKSDESDSKILKYIDYEPVLLDDLVRLSGFDMSNISAEILDLELAGLIEKLPGGKVQRI